MCPCATILRSLLTRVGYRTPRSPNLTVRFPFSGAVHLHGRGERLLRVLRERRAADA